MSLKKKVFKTSYRATLDVEIVNVFEMIKKGKDISDHNPDLTTKCNFYRK